METKEDFTIEGCIGMVWVMDSINHSTTSPVPPHAMTTAPRPLVVLSSPPNIPSYAVAHPSRRGTSAHALVLPRPGPLLSFVPSPPPWHARRLASYLALTSLSRRRSPIPLSPSRPSSSPSRAVTHPSRWTGTRRLALSSFVPSRPPWYPRRLTWHPHPRVPHRAIAHPPRRRKSARTLVPPRHPDNPSRHSQTRPPTSPSHERTAVKHARCHW